jgi:hypothetical protein
MDTISGGTVLFVLIVIAVILVWVVSAVQNRQRREYLLAKYENQEIVEAIMNKQLWQGATPEQVVDSWGEPEDMDHTVLKNKTKQTWKYGQIGKGRYRQRVFIEDDRVVGWQSQ